MDIRNTIDRWKMLSEQGIDLLLARLQILRLDLAAQAGGMLSALALILFAAVLLLLAGISLLFGLNNVLADEMKTVVFFGIPAVCVLLVIVLLLAVRSAWVRNNERVAVTLRDLQQDVAYLRGKSRQNELGKNKDE